MSDTAQVPEPVSGDEVTATGAWFVTTHWSVVLSARDKTGSHCDQALETLCRTYWYPLYAYIRRLGPGPQDAEDLTQEFFARLLQKDYLHAVAPEKGKFRTFLITAMKHFLANEWDRSRAQKRGSGQKLVPLDAAMAESRFQAEAAVLLAPDLAYDRQWAVTLLDQTLVRVQQEYERLEKGPEFVHLRQFLTVGHQSIPYARLAGHLGMSEAAARMAVHRLRRRFREVFREEIAHTVAVPGDVTEEMRYLLRALSL